MPVIEALGIPASNASNGEIMTFSLSSGIYKIDQHKKISLTVLLLMSPLIVGAVYVVWESIVQASTAENISDFLYYLYTEQQIFLILFTLLVSAIPLLLVSANARSSAYIKIDNNGFEYKLPLLARDISNGFSATRKVVPWSAVCCIRLYPGKKSQVKGIEGVPSSRLDNAKVAVITDDFQLYLNPYKWLLDGCDDHRLSIQEAIDLSEDAVDTALIQCPLMSAFNSFKQSS